MNTLVKKYLSCLESANLAELLDLFEDNTLVNSPLYGTLLARKFYRDLFNDTNQSKITLRDIFTSTTKPNVGSGFFRYDWTMKDGSQVFFECVDIFVLSDAGKIKELTIIYDTLSTRESFNLLKI